MAHKIFRLLHTEVPMWVVYTTIVISLLLIIATIHSQRFGGLP